MQIPRDFIELLLAKIDLVEFIGQQVPLRKKSGSNYFARCPFHNEKSASFSVSQPKQFYYCFGCGAHGNAIDFLMQNDRLSFPEAIIALARHAGMEVPHEANNKSKKQDSLPALYELMSSVTQYYYDQMRKSPRAIQYLKQRGISGAIAKQFHLGYAPTGWSHVFDEFGKTEEDKKKLFDTGIIIKKDSGGFYDRFRDRIMFPIHDYRGRIIGFGGRILDQGEPKYLNSPETPLFQKGHELYGLHQTLKANRQINRILIVEGYMDVIALFQHGITYAVATLGTATSSHHIERLFRYTHEIVFCFDGDKAGRTAAWRALEVMFPLMQDSLQVKFLFLPEGEDPDTLIRKIGKDHFEKSMNQALTLSAFFLQTIAKQNDLATMEGRAAFAAETLRYIKQLPAGVFQGILLDEVGKRARIDISEWKANLTVGKTPDVILEKSLPEQKHQLKLPKALEIVLMLIVQKPALAVLIDEPIQPSHLPGLSFLAALIAIVRTKPDISTAMLREHFRDQKEESFIARLAGQEHMIPDDGMENEFLGAIRQLKALNLDELINQLLAKATQDNLTEEEKINLTNAINQKKSLTATQHSSSNQ